MKCGSSKPIGGIVMDLIEWYCDNNDEEQLLDWVLYRWIQKYDLEQEIAVEYFERKRQEEEAIQEERRRRLWTARAGGVN